MGRTILIALVVAIVVGAAAGLVGYRLGDSAGFERANQVRQQFFQQRQTGQGQGQGGSTFGGAAAGRGMVAMQGVIKSVSGDTLTVTIGQRDVQVRLSEKTQVSKATSGDRTDLAAGARVMITPEGGGGGENVSAAAILILPAQ